MAKTRYDEQFRPEFSRLHHDRDLRWVVPFSVRYVVAVSGERFAGKSAALAYLAEKKGFELYSLAGTLRAEAVRLGVPLEPRYRLQDLGDELRAHFDDPAYLARITLRQIHRNHLSHGGMIEPLRRVAVGGFKRPEEITLFDSLGRFGHLTITTDATERLERARRSGIGQREVTQQVSGRELDAESFAELIDGRDLEGEGDRWRLGCGQAVAKVCEMPSARRVPNDGDLATLADLLDQEIAELDRRFGAFNP